ncbi:MFS transporter [Streptomyces sp. NPDC005438]|uniref:MFS transporter n=1 Tax=Streptomyces sp. NPDC005438 TaxID=3156880 RepID=UPI0033AC9FF9
MESETPGGGGSPHSGRRPVVVSLMLCMALAALDTTIVATAVPQIIGDLGGLSTFSWLFSGYLLAVTVTLPVYGRFCDTFGRKPVLLGGVGLFLLGSLLCAGAWNMASLIAFRVVQGLGGGAIQGTVQTVAADLYPLPERPKVQAALSSVWACSAVAGPGLGGLLVAFVDWRWIFLINLPVGGLALWLLWRNFREPRRPARRASVDWPGALAVFVCGGLLLTALVRGGVAWPWLSAPSLGLLGGALVAGMLVVVVERRATEPIIPGWVWRRRLIASVNLSLGAMGLLMVAPTVFLPTYAQTVLGLGPVAAGFVLSVMTLSWPVSAALSQHVYRRVGFRQSAMIGMTGALLTLLAFPLLPHEEGSAWQPALLSLLLGASLGIFQLPLIIGVQSSVPWRERGTATASILFHRQIGQCVGAAGLGAIANATLSRELADAPPDAPRRLDEASQALDHHQLGGEAGEFLRNAMAQAVSHVYLAAALAAALALLALLLAPRVFPVRQEDPAPGDQPAPPQPEGRVTPKTPQAPPATGDAEGAEATEGAHPSHRATSDRDGHTDR